MQVEVLNLYAGIGGNRKDWTCAKVTAVEMNPDIAAVYSDLYPQDTVIVGDAHEYLLENYQRFDFIWTSPPCPTHGQYRYNVGVRAKGYKAVYPDMKLYEEIIFLQYHAKGLYAVENVVSYYEPLIQPQKVGRHYVWSNFAISPFESEASNIRSKNKISDFQEYDLTKYKLSNKRQILRNCVNSSLGLHIFLCAQQNMQRTVGESAAQQALFTPEILSTLAVGSTPTPLPLTRAVSPLSKKKGLANETEIGRVLQREI